MSHTEHSPLITHAAAQYEAYEMDALPMPLQRNSHDHYYLSIYPGLMQMDDLSSSALPKLPSEIHSTYIHTPYCTGVCNFCSYVLTTVPKEDASPIAAYLGTVQSEILQRAKETNLDLSYLYFGGGTPSLIPPATLERFFTFLEDHQLLSATRFGTLELHPEFFHDLERAQTFIDVLKANGVGRVSLGFQSSDETILDDTNRRHTVRFLGEAIDFLKQNRMLVNLDLMYGLPGLSLEQWERTLEDAIACNPDSISTYFLFVDPGTVMHTQVGRGEIALPAHQLIQTQHIMAQTALQQHGFHELPNDFYAKGVGDPTTFTQDSLPSDSASLPLGAGSYGYYDKTQFFNQCNLQTYRQRVENGESPIWRGYRFVGLEGMHRDMMFSLKNAPYIDRSLFEAAYGVDPAVAFADTLEVLSGLGLLTVDDTTKRIALTPKGRLCVEEIACQFMLPNLVDNVPKDVSPSIRRTLAKHHFAPRYGRLALTGGGV